MAAINDLIMQIGDPELRAKIEQEVSKLSKQKKFGLVWEDHIPEATMLYDTPVKKGRYVARKSKGIAEIFYVLSVKDGVASCIRKGEGEAVEFAVEDLVCVAQFGEPIYPYLKPMDTVCNAPDSDLWHTLIEADNYHALQLLEYLYAGKVDCIYIDPPYNTGAKDWKYNNDYVDGADSYRHSKWLSMMEKRLKLAKKLLNPKDSVLIVTIDEKEYLHLGCLLEEIFAGCSIQMITSMTNKKGQPRTGIFSRCEEYIFVVFVGEAQIQRTTENMLFDDTGTEKESIKAELPTIWNSLLRRGTHADRRDRPKLFYPIIVDETKNKIHSVGEPLELDRDRHTYDVPDGCVAAWPLHKDGSEGNWQMKPETLRTALAAGVAKLGRKDKRSGNWSFVYLKRKQLKQVQTGEIVCEGRDENGALILKYPESGNSGKKLLQEPRSLWVKDSHDASVYGSTLLKGILVNRKFPFPKSLYAVQDTIRFFVAGKPNALIVDFFSGSGTTLHAINLLNAEDDGQRRCIMVTNNEVSADEARLLTAQGYQPGDYEWEKYGIARYITWPRTVCSIKGRDVKGHPLKGKYLGNDKPMVDGFRTNAAFFKLGFLDKTSVSLGRQFRELLPVLWMKAGAHGVCPVIESGTLPPVLLLPQNRFAVLLDESCYAYFVEQLNRETQIETVYIVTDSEAGYREMIAGIRAENTYQLYRDYLDNFRINTGR